MFNLYHAPSQLTPLANYESLPILFHFPSQPLESLACTENLEINLYNTAKKIKPDNTARALGNPQSYACPFLLSKPPQKAIKMPFKINRLSKKSNSLLSPSKEKKLVFKGHSFNLKGFADKSPCENITILTGKREHPDLQDKSSTCDSAQESPQKTPKKACEASPAVSTDTPQIEMPSVNNSYLDLYLNNINPYKDQILAKAAAMKRIEDQINSIKYSIQELQNKRDLEKYHASGNHIRQNMLIQDQPNLIKANPVPVMNEVFKNKNFSVKIGKPVEKQTGSGVTELKASNLAQGNTTFKFSSLGLKVNIDNKKLEKPTKSVMVEDLRLNSCEKQMNGLVDASISYFLMNDPLEQKIAYLEDQAMNAYMMNFGGLKYNP